jgi:hypothetical protein
MDKSREKCPDKGYCHHDCVGKECFRVYYASPFTSYGEDWKPEDYEERTKPGPSIDTVIADA